MSPLKIIYLVIGKVFNDKPIIFPSSRLELVELKIRKEAIYTWAWIFIISETIIDDQCHYEWWGPPLVISKASMRWEWLSVLFW